MGKPVAHRRGDEFGSVVTPYVLRNAMLEEEFGEDVEHVVARHPSLHPDGQTLPRVFVDHREQT